jgi:hypothetical protein
VWDVLGLRLRLRRGGERGDGEQGGEPRDAGEAARRDTLRRSRKGHSLDDRQACGCG